MPILRAYLRAYLEIHKTAEIVRLRLLFLFCPLSALEAGVQ